MQASYQDDFLRYSLIPLLFDMLLKVKIKRIFLRTRIWKFPCTIYLHVTGILAALINLSTVLVCDLLVLTLYILFVDA